MDKFKAWAYLRPELFFLNRQDMTMKELIINLPSVKETKFICASGCQILAMYPSSLLVRCDQTQLKALKKARVSYRELQAS